MRWSNKIRISLAILQTSLLCLILVSGSLFMHKHTTAAGKIVIHVHPYNISNEDAEPTHHTSEDEIHFLDIVFHGNYLLTAIIGLHNPVIIPFNNTFYLTGENIHSPQSHDLTDLRGPPACTVFA